MINNFYRRGRSKDSTIQELTVCVPSPNWTSSMEQVRENCESLNIKFYWIRHGDASKDFPNDVNIIQYNHEATHAEEFFFASITQIDEISWVLRIDDDEVVSELFLKEISSEISKLREDTLYGVPRIWVKQLHGNWMKFLLAKPSNGEVDVQYRLFHISGARESVGIHTSGVRAKRKSILNITEPILHLIWVLTGVEDRMAKVQHYESIKDGAGLGKIRYYLPELFPISKNWEKLSVSDIYEIERWFVRHRKGQNN